MNEDRLYLVHIHDSIARVEEYTQGGRDPFFQTPLIQDAVLRNLQIMAESTQRLSDATKNRYPAIPWREIAGFRNRVTHGYFNVNFFIVWDVIENSLPALKETVASILEAEHREPKSG